MTLYAELEMAHGLIQVYRDGKLTAYAYSNVRRATGRAALARAGWTIPRGADWKLVPPNSFRLPLASGPN